MKFITLHLSDIHFRAVGDPIIKRATSLARAAISKAPDAKACIVVISGDIANTGDPTEYAVAWSFFQDIQRELLTAFPKVQFIAVPGNHDCNLKKQTDTRIFLLDSLAKFFAAPLNPTGENRSEEHTSELQSHSDIVCRLLLEKKKTK